MNWCRARCCWLCRAVLAACCLVNCSRGCRLPQRSLLTAGLLLVHKSMGCSHIWLPAWRSGDLSVVWASLLPTNQLTACVGPHHLCCVVPVCCGVTLCCKKPLLPVLVQKPWDSGCPALSTHISLTMPAVRSTCCCATHWQCAGSQAHRPGNP